MSCATRDVNITEGASTTLPSIPGFGIPTSIVQPPNPLTLPSDQPEDLNTLMQSIYLQLPPSKQYPNVTPSFSKNLSDQIYSLIEQLSPFLNLFKFILPIFRLINGIIEVICSLINPFALFGAVARLFNDYIPEFLALYPAFSLVVIILSILKIILQIADYMLGELTKLVKVIDKNLKIFSKALETGSQDAINAASKKFSFLLCYFQNILAVFSMITAVEQIIEEMLKFTLGVPCQGGDNSDCCNNDICPPFLQNSGIKGTAGAMKFFGDVTNINISNIYIPIFGTLSNNVRNHAYQIYDDTQVSPLQFINMTNGKYVFFPTDSIYTSSTIPEHAPYTVDIRFYYDPVKFERTGVARFIRFNNCILLSATSTNLKNWDLSTSQVSSGVLQIAGGLGFEDDNKAILYGISSPLYQATLETFIYSSTNVMPTIADEIIFDNLEYSLNPNYLILFGKSLISIGCVPEIKQSKNSVDNFPQPVIPPPPDLTIPYTAITHEVDTLASNLNHDTLSSFNKNVTSILENLKSDTSKAISNYIDLAFDRYNSTFTLDPHIQFTGDFVKVTITLKDRNDLIITDRLSTDNQNHIIDKLKISNSFGSLSIITYQDPYFIANIGSDIGGDGSAYVIYNGQTVATLTPSVDGKTPSTIKENIQDYTFIQNINVGAETGDPRRDISDTLS